MTPRPIPARIVSVPAYGRTVLRVDADLTGYQPGDAVVIVPADEWDRLSTVRAYAAAHSIGDEVQP